MMCEALSHICHQYVTGPLFCRWTQHVSGEKNLIATIYVEHPAVLREGCFWPCMAFVLSQHMDTAQGKIHFFSSWGWKKAEVEMVNKERGEVLCISCPFLLSRCMCGMGRQRQRSGWSLLSAWPGPISDSLSCVITVGSLTRQWTEAT